MILTIALHIFYFLRALRTSTLSCARQTGDKVTTKIPHMQAYAGKSSKFLHFRYFSVHEGGYISVYCCFIGCVGLHSELAHGAVFFRFIFLEVRLRIFDLQRNLAFLLHQPCLIRNNSTAKRGEKSQFFIYYYAIALKNIRWISHDHTISRDTLIYHSIGAYYTVVSYLHISGYDSSR